MRNADGEPIFPYVTPEERFEAASSPAAAPTVVPGVATIADGPAATERFRMITVLHGLKLEAAGIRANRRFSMLKVARGDYGIKARDAATAYTRMRQLMEQRGIIVHDGKPHEVGGEDEK